MSDQSNVPELRDSECAEILEWFQELDGPCTEARAVVLGSQLGSALRSFMDIDAEILSQAFLADCRRKRGGSG